MVGGSVEWELPFCSHLRLSDVVEDEVVCVEVGCGTKKQSNFALALKACRMEFDWIDV